jgi:hypothetical protein
MIKMLFLFAFCYCVLSAILLALLILLWPGFPFFPKRVFTTKTDGVASVILKKGTYYICFFVGGSKSLQVRHGDVGKLSVLAGPSDQKEIPVIPSNFYFEETVSGGRIHGHAIGKFLNPVSQEVFISGGFRKAGYDGLLIRSGFSKMVLSMGSFEILAFLASAIVTKPIHKVLSKTFPGLFIAKLKSEVASVYSRLT